MKSNTSVESFQADAFALGLKPWSRWSWKKDLSEAALGSPTIEHTSALKSNPKFEDSIATPKSHFRSTLSETIELNFSSSSKHDADFSGDGGYNSSSDEDIFFKLNDDMSTKASDTSSSSSCSQPSSPGKSTVSRFSTISEGDASTESELSWLFEDSLEPQPNQPPADEATNINEREENKEIGEEKYTIAGNGLKYPELSPRQFALEKRRIMIRKLILGRKDELGISVREPQIHSSFTGWAAFPEFLKR